MDGKVRCQDNIFVERLWQTVKYKEVYLKARVAVLEAQRRLEACFRFHDSLKPHQPWAAGLWPRSSKMSRRV